MSIHWPSSFDLDGKVVEPTTHLKDGGGTHPSNKNLNPKPATVLSVRDAVHYRTSTSFMTDLEAGQTGVAQEGDPNDGGVRSLLSRLKEFLWKHFRRVGSLTCPGCLLC